MAKWANNFFLKKLHIAGKLISGATVGSEIYVSKDGDDATGNGTVMAPYLTVTKAFSVVSSARKTILVNPGTYEEAASLTWPTVSGTKLIGASGQYTTVIGVASGDQVITVAPGVVSSTFEMWIVNIQIDHDSAGLDGLVLNNTSMTKKLNVYMRNVGFEADSDSDKSILVTHGDLSNAVRIYGDGENGDVGGVISWSAHNNGDRLHLKNMKVVGGITFGSTAVVTSIQLQNCQFKHAGMSGGHANTVFQAVACYTNESGTWAPMDSGDVQDVSTLTGSTLVAFD